MDGRIEIVQRDITGLAVEAIIDTANNSLLDGGEDGAAARRTLADAQ